MNCNSAVSTLLMTLVVLFGLNPAAVAQPKNFHRCSNATVKGTYGINTTGVLVSIGPAAASGISTLDGRANVSGSQTRSVNGDVADETFQGKYEIKSDCTGTEVVQVYESGQLVRTSTLQLVIEENGNSGHAIFSKIELPDHTVLPSVLTLDAKRLFPKDDH
jgi:hypothetical protein